MNKKTVGCRLFKDGSLCISLTTNLRNGSEIEILTEMASLIGSKLGLISYNQFPEIESYASFVKMADPIDSFSSENSSDDYPPDDISYVVCCTMLENRDFQALKVILTRFLPNRQNLPGDYWTPKDSQNESFESEEQMIHFAFNQFHECVSFFFHEN